MPRALSCAWTGPRTLYEEACARRHVDLCRMRHVTTHVVRVGSEHVSGLSGTVCKHARHVRLSGRVVYVCDLVSYGPASGTSGTSGRLGRGSRRRRSNE
eukprot:2118846-Prymnesium_polylepis.1